MEKKLERLLINKSILFVFPHPDDETVMAGGLIQQALTLGGQVTVLILTDGSRGKIHVSGRGRSLGEIRRDEFIEAMRVLGVSDWVLWHFDDGRLKSGHRWRSRLKSYLELNKPEVVVSYDLSGVTGHPDHISLSKQLLRWFRAGIFGRLLWVSFDGEEKKRMVLEKVERYLRKPQYALWLNIEQSLRKWVAVTKYKSQKLREYVGGPWWWLVFFRRNEWYSEAEIGKKYKYKYIRFKI